MAAFELVSVIVPALNESATLTVLYERVANALNDQPFEFIVIDDGSTDGTFASMRALHEAHPGVVVLRHGRPHGKSLALMQGFSVARGDVAVLMDADLQDIPEEIPQFLAKLEEGYDLVNGWRHQRRDSMCKNMVSRLFNTIVRKALDCPLHDINCGFKAIRRVAYRRLELTGDYHRLIPAIVRSMGYRITEIPVTHAPRTHGKSHYHLLRHRGLLDIVAHLASNTTQKRPFHVFSEIGILCALIALLSAIGAASLYLYIPDSRIATVAAVALACGSLWGVFLGSFLPLIGLHLEVITRSLQGERWRTRLLHETLDTRT